MVFSPQISIVFPQISIHCRGALRHIHALLCTGGAHQEPRAAQAEGRESRIAWAVRSQSGPFYIVSS